MRYVPIAGYWQSVGALTAGWVVASMVLATSWLISPPTGVEVLAVGIGLVEATVSLVAMGTVGSMLHWWLTGPGAAFLPTLAVYRTLIMGFVGALVGAVSFSLGLGGVRGVTE
jgi:hypothetical protein